MWFLCRSQVARRVLWKPSPPAQQNLVSWASVTPACQRLLWLQWHQLPLHCQQHPSHPHRCLRSARVSLVLGQSQQNPARGTASVPYVIWECCWLFFSNLYNSVMRELELFSLEKRRVGVTLPLSATPWKEVGGWWESDSWPRKQQHDEGIVSSCTRGGSGWASGEISSQSMIRHWKRLPR